VRRCVGAGSALAPLAGLGRYDATIRLTLAEGSGSAPGRATLTLVDPGRPTTLSGAAEAAADSLAARVPAGPPAPARPASSTAIVSTTGGTALHLANPAASFARGARGGTAPGAIAAGIDAIRDDEIASGRYASAVAIDSIRTDEDSVRVYVRVAEGPAVTLEALELPGAGSTRPSTAATIAGLKPGTVLTPALLEDARERLLASNLFLSVGEPRVTAGSEPSRARVVVPVEEASASSFQGALGLGSGGGLTGLLDVALGNIGGTGRSAGARWAGLGDGNSNYALRYREPALFGRPVDATFQLDAQVADSLYTQTRWALGFGVRPRARVQGSLALARASAVYTGVGRGSSSTWSADGRVEWHGLTPRLNPTGGWGASLELESGKRTESYPGYPQSTRSLLRDGFSVETARSLGGRRVLYGRVRADQVSLGDGAFPAEELLYLGGSNGLRGHRDRAYAGSRVLAMSLEQRWITGPTGRAYFFLDAARHELGQPVDAGIVTDPAAASSLARTILSDGWELGYGAGLLTRMASGVVGLELGTKPGASLSEATIHVRYSSQW
jgi:outer membrane protein assembly factor BamA